MGLNEIVAALDDEISRLQQVRQPTGRNKWQCDSSGNFIRIRCKPG